MNGWRKSTYSYANGNCVKVGWQKAQASNGHSQNAETGAGACGTVHVRDSKDPGGRVLAFTRAGWDAFIKGVKNGELDDATPGAAASRGRSHTAPTTDADATRLPPLATGRLGGQTPARRRSPGDSHG